VAELQSGYEVRRCTNVVADNITIGEDGEAPCGLRFPVEKKHSQAISCPRCGAPTQAVVDIPRQLDETSASQRATTPTENTIQLELLLDNVRSLFNVGSIFRCADGVGVRHLHLCGITPTPDNPKLKKTALGAEDSIHNVPLPDDKQPITLIVGNEVTGIDPHILALCEYHLYIPMHGIKRSLNVSTATGVAVYSIASKAYPQK